MLHGSMSPHDIGWNLSLALGYQLEAEWWETIGAKAISIGFEARKEIDRLRG